MRIVSLLASATEMVYELGLGDAVVAISHECDYPPEALHKPRVSRPSFDPSGLDAGEIDAAVRRAMADHGAVYTVDTDRLREVDPDLILTQAVCDVCAVPTSDAEQAARALGGRARILSLDAHTVKEILDGVRQIGGATGVADRAAALIERYRERIEVVRARVAGRPRPRVLAIEWLDPPFVPGHWTPEMIELAGGENLRGEIGRPSRRTTWEELGDLDPDVLLVMPCGYGLDGARAEADRSAEQLGEIAPRAVEGGRAFVLNGSAYFNRSGPRVVDGIEILGALLHPDRFPEYDFTDRAGVWSGEVPRDAVPGAPATR